MWHTHTLFCVRWVPITIFGESSFTFSFVGLVTWDWGAHLRLRQRKQKCQKTNVNLFTTKLGWIISRSCQGPKSLEATVLYNESQHNIPALQGRANKHGPKVSFLLPTFLMSHFVVTKIYCCLPSWQVIL